MKDILRGEVFITGGDTVCQNCGDCPLEGCEMIKVFKTKPICKACFKNWNAYYEAPPPPTERQRISAMTDDPTKDLTDGET